MQNNIPPECYEILPPEFLRKFGAQKDMKYWHYSMKAWVAFLEGHLSEIMMTQWVFIAPLGTTAAALTPLPEPACRNCSAKEVEHLLDGTCPTHIGPKTKLESIRYRHVLPGELAGMEKKPEELLKASKGKNDWHEVETWPLIQRFVDGVYDFAYCLPLPLSTEHKEETLGTFLQTSESAQNLSPDSVATQPQEERREDVLRALQAADAGNAGHWPTVAAILADEVRRLSARIKQLESK